MFHSILFERPEDGPLSGPVEEPEFFGDLNLGQMVSEATKGFAEYNLAPFFYTPLSRTDAIAFRHEVMRDLENPVVLASVKVFADGMRTMRLRLAQAERLYYPLQKQWWLLESARTYSEALSSFANALEAAEPQSKGLRAFQRYLSSYIASDQFHALVSDADAVKCDLDAVQYCTLVKGNAVTVRHYDGERDYSAEVLSIFEKFKQGAAKERCDAPRDSLDMNHVEAQVLDCVARLEPQPFTKLAVFCAQHADFLDTVVATFDREVQFYLAYAAYLDPCRAQDLSFCYPQISTGSKVTRCEDTFDIVLAHKLATEKARVVCNDLYLKEGEHLIVVSGPNNGGKTTFARMFGQLHYLSRLGFPVPGCNARLFLCDALFTHFEREENTQDMRGKLRDDLIRIHDVLTRATPKSVIVMNEIFSSTTLTDALFLSKRVISEILELGALCLCVTFIEELARMSDVGVSMVSEVDPAKPTLRTYRIRRREPGSEAYAMSVARQYRLTYEQLTERLGL
ncbi:hypothetical protein LGM57_34095 [Burkholderia cepacia]|uniref:MutS-related protein n=1 Tax=Burkholderia cepacia TaxID=292 RepID=UPI001CF55A58|nr:hypothetical protein [Burkholderia cepacia]MCA7981368.1 hypothetical protein [Burkholderia cepacia]HDR9497154.1 hypothetical protein [Burkholderia cepacia]